MNPARNHGKRLDGRRSAVSPVVSFPPSFARTFSSRERETSGYEAVVRAMHQITLYALTAAQLVSLILIHWIVIYLVNDTIQPLNNWSLIVTYNQNHSPTTRGSTWGLNILTSEIIRFFSTTRETGQKGYLRLNQSKYTADDDIDSVGN